MADEKMRLTVMADYECYPIWRESPGGVTNLAPEELGLPEGLVASFNVWALRFEETFDVSDPRNSGFADAESANHFYSRGLELARELAHAIGDEAEVRYFDGRTGKSSLV